MEKDRGEAYTTYKGKAKNVRMLCVAVYSIVVGSLTKTTGDDCFIVLMCWGAIMSKTNTFMD